MNFSGRLLINKKCLAQLFRSCSKVRSFKITKQLHALTITIGSFENQQIFVCNNIVSMYATVGELSVARKVFDKMSCRSGVSYNTLIGSYGRCGLAEEAWNMFYEMRVLGFEPTQFTLGGLLSCDWIDLNQGNQLKALAIKNGLFSSNAFVGTSLLVMYGRRGWLDEAICVFEDMPFKTLVTWNSMISLLGHYGFVEKSVFLFRELIRMKCALSESSLVAILSGIFSKQDLEIGRQIHGLVIKKGFICEIPVVNSLITVYAKYADICWVERLFVEVPVRDIVTWNSIIGTVAKSQKPERALYFLLEMSICGVLPNAITYVNILQSCVNLAIPRYGESVHAKIIKRSFGFDVFVGTALVDFYSKSGNLIYAHQCFDDIIEKNVVSWNSLIYGYSKNCSLTPTSTMLLREMLRLGLIPNEVSFSMVLKSSLELETHQLHCLIIRMGYQNNDYVLSSLIVSYASNGLISDAIAFVTEFNSPLPAVPSNIIASIYNRTGQYDETLMLLSQLEEPDSVSWNMVIAACARNNYYEEVFDVFKQMRIFDILPDNYTFVSLLSVCVVVSNLSLGSSIHGLIMKTNFDCCDTFVCNMLIDMYGKCGIIESSTKIFYNMKNRNLITWTILISALGFNGYASKALEQFKEMELLGFKPDGVALNTVLTACRHGGLVREGMSLFRKMKKNYGVEPDMHHYHNVVDLLANHGHFQEAEEIISGMPFPPNAAICRSFLEGRSRHASAIDQLPQV